MYAINATVTRKVDGWVSTVQVPTFYLDPNVQGITDAFHAQQIAAQIINPFDAPVVVAITAVRVSA